MTSTRPRNHASPQSPPDRLPPRRCGGSTPSPYTYASAARRGLVRSARALAAAALLAILGALFLPDRAQAQAIVLVSNIGQTSDTTHGTRNGGHQAQVFTVPSGGGNYTLTSIEAPIVLTNITALTAEDMALFSASLWSGDEFGDPVSSLQALTNPSSISHGDTAAFTDPAGTTLEAGKSYAVVFVYEKNVAELAIKAVGSGNEDGESLSGWNIYNSSRNLAAGETSWTSDANSLQIRVNGSAAGGDPPTNNAPVFTSSASLSVEENTTNATVVAVDNDTDDGITSYAITGGTDQDFFDNVTSAGVLSFDEAPNFEDPKDSGTDNTYVVTVQATSGTGTREMTATQTITVTVTDADEKSAKPDKPTLAKVTGSSTSLTATWTKPDLNGGPDIAGYDVAYREGTTGLWEDFSYVTSGLTTTITGLTADTSYQARVRATNGELLSDWSDASDAVSTNAATPGTLPTLSIADAAAAEGSNVSFMVTLSAADAADVTATWTASIETGDTAVAADLGATKTGTVTVSMGNTTGTFTVATVEDTTVEVNETFTVTLSSPSSNAQLSSTAATAQGTINNDDLATVSVGDAEGDEDDGVEFTLTLSAAAPADVTVDWTASIESGDSASTADLATTKTGTVTITKGDTTKRFTAPVNDDSTDEPDQTFTVTLSNPTPTSLAQLAADPTAEGTIEDDDDPPTISVVDMTVIEGDLNPDNVPTFNNNPGFPWTVMLSEASEKRVRYRSRQVVDGTATDADLKVTVAFSGRPSIQAGQTSVVRGVNNIVNDALDEDDETFTIEVYDLESATAGAKTRSTITIVDDDPTPTVTVADAAATEGDKVEFVVTLSAVSGRDVDVDYATSVATGDGAVSGTDFTAASGTLTIAADDNTATGTIEVQTTEDDASESAETFTLTISSPDNATLTTDTTATGTINNRATTAAEPTTFAAAVGDAQVVLSWDAPDSASGVTRHEYQYKEGTGAYKGWERIANSGVGGANEAGFTVTGLTNEVLHTFQLRAVNAQGESTAAESDAVTPTPGICGRTAKIQEVILAELADVSECAAVTVANLASITTFGGALGLATFGQGITSLAAGDFGGLTALTKLNLGVNDLTTLPAGIFSGLAAIEEILLNGNELTALPEGTFAGITTLAVIDLASNSFTAIPARTFSGLTALTALDLSGNDLTALPDGLFSGLSALESLSLSGNDLTALPAGLFSGLSALSTLTLYENDLVSLPAGLFSGLTALDTLDLEDNDLTALPDRLFNGLTALESLRLEGNDLTALPAGLLSGLTKLRVLTLGDNPNTGDTLALTVTVEKFGTDQARAKVLAGAPAALSFNVTVANGSLTSGVPLLTVAAGSVEGTAVTVTRTSGTMAAVTVDIDLTHQPTRPSGFTGFTFAKATSGLPAEILPDTRSPQNFTAKPGDGQAVLSWTAPASGSGVTKHQYRQKAGTGSYGSWIDIPNSAAGGANEDGYTVTGLTNETVYTFELKRFVGTTESAAAESNAVTPTPGICDRTQQVQDGILAKLADVAECEAVTVANLAGISRLDLDDKGITSLKAGDFTGLTGMTTLILNDNDLTSLPAGVFSGLTALSSLFLVGNDLSSLPANVFSGLTSLGNINLRDNDLNSLPANVFSGLTSLWNISLRDNDLSSLPATVFSGLTSLINIDLLNNDLTSLPDGLFSGLTGLEDLVLGANPNSGDELPLTVTLEKVGEDRVRAKVLAGAPFAVAIPVTPANGTLAGGVTMLTVAAGSVESAAVTVTRTEGTTAAVTVDVDLTNQPSLPPFHLGYFFARAASGLPAVILPEEASLEPPTGLRATPGDREAVLAWTPPAPDSGFTRHQYRYRTTGDFEDWTDIPDSGPGEANATRYTVTGLDNAVEHTFELRARDAGAGKSEAATVRVEPTGPPRILSVEVTSGPGLDNGTTYGVGEEIRISVTFDQRVEVEGDPELALDAGGPRLAEYDSGGGSETLVFVYVVTADDSDADGVSIGDDALRLDGGDVIRNGAGDGAELAHDEVGAQPGHRVDGGRRAGVHTHEAFTHEHSHFNDGKGFYTQTYPDHAHEGHEHPDTANEHSEAMRPGEHVHHAQEDPDASRFGPDLRTHGDVDHIHRCFDIKPSCNKGSNYYERGDELGLPIEVTHSHADSEPGHRFDWRAFFEEGGSGAAVTVADAEAVRGEDAALDFEVRLDPAQAFAVRVEYATADGTATAGEDYRETAGVLEIPPGETRATVRVRILEDGAGDGPELFELRLDTATAATVADGAATGTIRTPGPSTPPVIERIRVVSTPRLVSRGGTEPDTYGEGETIRIEVRFDQPVVVEGEPAMAVEVGDPCLAVCEARYASGSGTDTLVFAYLVLEVDIDSNGIWIGADPIGESIDDLDGFRIRNAADRDADLSYRRLGRQSGHKTDGSRSAASHLSVADAEAHEADGEMMFTVRLEPHGLGIVTVDYATADGTGSKAARAGSDYTETSGTLTFASLETERTVTVPIIDDTEQDDGETFTLTLSNPDGAALRSGEAKATGTIRNSEPQEALTASFEDMPGEHDGESAFTFRVAFSADIGISYKALREDAFAVSGGRVTGGKRVDDRRDLFEMTVAPDGGGDVAIVLEADRDCALSGAICTKGEPRRKLTNSPSATVAGPGEAPANAPAEGAPAISGTARVGGTLTVSTSGVSDADGLGNAVFAYQWIRGGADIPGATGASYTAVEADEGERLKVRVEFTDDAGNAESLTSAATDAVEAAPRANMPAEGAPTISGTARVGGTLTASMSGVTDADGLDDATFAYQWIRGGADIPGATGASYTAVEADLGERLKVRVGFADDAGNEESLTSAATGKVAARPQPKISVADARVREAAGATLDFEVTLSAPAPGPVTVDYRTVDASAKAGADYAARQGTLTFRAGETMKTVSVTVLDDAHDEGREILVLTLDNARGGVLADRFGVGKIENADPLQRAWLSRFGRMAALQVVDHVEARLAARRKPGFRGRFAGRELRRGMERDIALSFLRRLGRTAAPGPIGGVAAPTGGVATSTDGIATPMGSDNPMGGVAALTGMRSGTQGGGSPPDGVGLDWGRLLRMGLGGGDVMTGSDFALDRETGLGGIVSVWSRGSMSRFTGREGALSLGGDVRTTMFGTDYAQGPLVAGLMLSHSRGLGEYAGVDAGLLRSSVTGLYPWLGYRATNRISVWAVTGYGTGGLLLTPEGVAPLRSGLSMAMVAAGARGALAGVAGGGGTGFGLSFKADALWVGTSIAGVDGPDGRLAAASSSVTRVRTALEGSGGFTFGGGLSLKPSVEVGLRHDGGDADAGSGLDLGGGLVVADASTGLVVDVRARTLLAHEAEGFSERGVSVQFSWNPSPSTPLGFTARVAPSWGVQATGGAEALWGRETMAGVGARGGPAPGNRLDAEMGYGLPLGGRFVGTPRVGVRTSAAGRDYLLGYSLGVLGGGVLNLSLGVDAHRRESPARGAAEHGVAGRIGVRW